MRKSSSGPSYVKPEANRQEPSRMPSLVVLFIIFALGLAGGAYFFNRSTPVHGPEKASQTADAQLSESSLAVLKGLSAPVAIRFYALLDPATVPATTKDFATRVSYLLSAYQRAANGMIKVTRFTALKEVPANKPEADGIRPFNMDKGEPCFLGITLEQKEQKETFAQLAPDWESALEADLTRAIARVSINKPDNRIVVVEKKINTATIEEVKRALPDLANITIEEGTRLLREKTMAAVEKTSRDMEPKIKEIEQRLALAQINNSESAMEAARKDLQQIKSEQTQSIQTLALKLKEQISVLEQMKKK